MPINLNKVKELQSTGHISLEGIKKLQQGNTQTNTSVNTKVMPKTAEPKKSLLERATEPMKPMFSAANSALNALAKAQEWHDKTSQKVSKEAMSVLGAVPQAMMKTVVNVKNIAEGKPQDWTTERSLKKDILPKQYGKFVDTLAQKGPLGELASGFIQGSESLLDPTTYIGGGIADDLSKAGITGKGAKVGTIENVESNAARNQKILTKEDRIKKITKGAKTATETLVDGEQQFQSQNSPPITKIGNTNVSQIKETPVNGTQKVKLHDGKVGTVTNIQDFVGDTNGKSYQVYDVKLDNGTTVKVNSKYTSPVETPENVGQVNLPKSETVPENGAHGIDEGFIRDESGKPITVYHGTNKSFKEFDKSKNKQNTMYGGAFYFTDSLDSAKTYAEKYRNKTPDSRVINANIKSKKMWDYDNDKITPEQFEEIFNRDGYLEPINKPTKLGQLKGLYNFTYGLEELGYDGLKIKETNGSTTYAVFNPEQISQIDNAAETTAQKGAQEVPVQFKGVEPGEEGYNPIKVGAQVQFVKGAKQTVQTPKFEFSNSEIEATHKANKGIKEATVPEKIKQIATDVKNMFTRPIGTLPYTKENAELYKELVKLPKIRAIAADDTVRTLDDIAKGMDQNGFDMFERRVLLEDLAEEANRGNKLQNKWTPEEVQKELARLDEAMPDNVKEALNKRVKYWDGLKNDYIKAMKDIGIDMSDALNRENYFRHQVLDYVQAQNSLMNTGKRLKSPTGRSYTKARTGEYEGNINTDYLQSEFEVMAQMKHDTEIAKTIKAIDTNYNIADQLKSQAKQIDVNWKDLIPEGYTTWQPRQGNAFYMSQPLGAEIVEQSLAMRGIKLTDIKDPKLKVALEDIMNDLADQTSVLAMGGKRKEWVVKQEVADTLNNLTKATTTNALSKLSKNVQSAWKRWILTLNPKSVIKYNIRNLSGDLDGMLAGNPSSIKKVPKSAAELREAMANGKFTPELKSWYDRGGYQSLLYAQEISQVNKLKPFEKFRNLSTTEKVTKPLRQYAEVTQNLTNYREAIGRYAAYLDYLDQFKNGKLKNYGASRPEIIDGLKSNEDKAFKLSNDLFGAYDEVSQAGHVIRNHLIPFYSWMEINMKRYKNLFKNAFTDGAGQTVKLTGITAAKLGAKTSTKIAGIFAMTAALSAWNQLMYPDLEEELPEDVRNQPHVIFGKDNNGNIRYFSRLGSLNDFLGWFGLDNAPQDVRDIMNGKMTTQEFVTEAIKSPINKVAGSVSPAYKTPAELATGKKLYPDVFESTNIRDKAQYAAQSIGLKDEYDVVAGKPHRPYFNTLTNAVEYKADPEEQAYYTILDLKAKYKDKVLGVKSGGGLYGDKKSDALYNYKLALRYKDETAKKKYLNQYFQYGGTEKGLTQSLKALNPLYGLSVDQQTQFFGRMTVKERDKLKQAMKFYTDILSPSEN